MVEFDDVGGTRRAL